MGPRNANFYFSSLEVVQFLTSPAQRGEVGRLNAREGASGCS